MRRQTANPAADFFHSKAQLFFIVPLRHFGENTLQLLIRLLFSRGDFFAVVCQYNVSLPCFACSITF